MGGPLGQGLHDECLREHLALVLEARLDLAHRDVIKDCRALDVQQLLVQPLRGECNGLVDRQPWVDVLVWDTLGSRHPKLGIHGTLGFKVHVPVQCAGIGFIVLLKKNHVRCVAPSLSRVPRQHQLEESYHHVGDQLPSNPSESILFTFGYF